MGLSTENKVANLATGKRSRTLVEHIAKSLGKQMNDSTESTFWEPVLYRKQFSMQHIQNGLQLKIYFLLLHV